MLDEGGAIGEGLVPGVAAPVALIGIAEKGYVTLALTASAEGGHSSMPPPHTAIGILAAAIERVEGNPLPASLSGATRQFLAAVAPEMEFPLRIAVANADILEPIVLRVAQRLAALERDDPHHHRGDDGATAASRRTRCRRRRARIVNFRILPGDTVQSVTEFVRQRGRRPARRRARCSKARRRSIRRR